MRKGSKSKVRMGGPSQVPAYTSEENLQRLSRTSILENFVRDNDCSWDHQKWLELCNNVEKFGYSPIDFDQMGLMLEDIKARYPNI
ncbi:MAG TPA: hypothetical protein DET40_04730 [Lentisphaeria bacterium]|nr:MAG: hypothetical protein A2X45_21395 [Lentisphaerae bacterium GWF2_50_93]HCE42830.1 hypothetical protein [Lentisphaeria bacterium]